jgi:hypothetical protein
MVRFFCHWASGCIAPNIGNNERLDHRRGRYFFLGFLLAKLQNCNKYIFSSRGDVAVQCPPLHQ